MGLPASFLAADCSKYHQEQLAWGNEEDGLCDVKDFIDFLPLVFNTINGQNQRG